MLFFNKLQFKKHGTKYKLMVAVISLVFFIFFSSRFIFNTPMENEDTPLRSPINVANNVTIEFASKEFYTNENILEVDILVKDKGNSIPVELGLEVKEKTDTKAKYKHELIKITDEYYVIFIHGLPEKWKSVSLQFFDKNEEESMMNPVENRMYVSSTSTQKYDLFTKNDKGFYEEKYINLLIKDAEEVINNEQKNITKSNEDQQKIKDKIDTIKDELEYKTEQQKTAEQQNITSLESQIGTLKSQNEKSEELIIEQQEIIKKLEEKRSNLVY